MLLTRYGVKVALTVYVAWFEPPAVPESTSFTRHRLGTCAEAAAFATTVIAGLTSSTVVPVAVLLADAIRSYHVALASS